MLLLTQGSMACRQMYISFRNNIISKFVQKAKNVQQFFTEILRKSHTLIPFWISQTSLCCISFIICTSKTLNTHDLIFPETLQNSLLSALQYFPKLSVRYRQLKMLNARSEAIYARLTTKFRDDNLEWKQYNNLLNLFSIRHLLDITL